MKGSCRALEELWGFLSASWLQFLDRKVLGRSSPVSGSSGEAEPFVWALGHGFVPVCHLENEN